MKVLFEKINAVKINLLMLYFCTEFYLIKNNLLNDSEIIHRKGSWQSWDKICFLRIRMSNFNLFGERYNF